jgi:hypothetical protein
MVLFAHDLLSIANWYKLLAVKYKEIKKDPGKRVHHN